MQQVIISISFKNKYVTNRALYLMLKPPSNRIKLNIKAYFTQMK